jgi:hypothetical protein
MTMAFDSLKFAHRLEQTGVPREQAEAHAELARDMIIADLATKGDIALVRSDLTVAVKDLRSDLTVAVKELQSEMKLVEQRIIIRLGAMIVAAVGILAAIQKLF